MAKDIRKQVQVTVFVTIGPYPVDYLVFKEKLGRERTIELMKQGMDEAAQLCQNTEDVVGIGEIGRPHFPVEEQIIKDSNDILLYGMQQAKDVNVPVILHTETTTPKQCQELVDMGKKAGLSADKIVKHYAPPLVTFEENAGLMPSVLASKKNMLEAIQKGTRFLMETDYIDDPKRPGAVLGPKTVPKVTKQLMDLGILSEEEVYKIHVENPKQTYTIDLDE